MFLIRFAAAVDDVFTSAALVMPVHPNQHGLAVAIRTISFAGLFFA